MIERDVQRLAAHHGWRAAPGCSIFVVDRGAVRFDYPSAWALVPGEGNVSLYDAEPPDDNSRLTVSYIALPPVDWKGLSLEHVLDAATRDSARQEEARGAIVTIARGDLEIAWRDIGFTEAGRQACSFVCVARRPPIQALVTFDFWESDRGTCRKAWDTVLETLRLAEYIADPARGPLVS